MSRSLENGQSIGIVIPVYNGESFIGEAIDSVLNQDSAPNTFCVFDNKSTDATAEILRSYQERFGISVITATEHFPRMVDSWNFAVNQVDTTWFHLMSADDLLKSSFVREFRKHLNEEYAAISMLSEEIDELGEVTLAKFSLGNARVIQGSNLVLANLFTSSINVASVLVKKSAWTEVGGYPSEYSYWHDMVFWQRIASFGGVRKVNQVVARYRVDRGKQKTTLRANGIDRDRQLYLSSELPRLESMWGLELRSPQGQGFSSKASWKRTIVLNLSGIKKFLYKVGWIKW